MKVSGFSLCRNGLRLGFPFRESIRSLAPLCDEIVIACGESDDGTEGELEKLQVELSSSCHLRILRTTWDLTSIKGGAELARQSNLALDACKNDLCFYLQADEVLHESDYPLLRADLEQLSQHPKAKSLVLQWIHFYGDAHTCVYSRRWYRKEIRAIKKSSGLMSFQDAQSFRVARGEGASVRWEKAPALESQGRIFHYGWIRPPDLMTQKAKEFQFWWGPRETGLTSNNIFRPQYGIRSFHGSHPAVMKNFLSSLKSSSSLSRRTPLTLESLRCAASGLLEKLSGWRPGEFVNYSKLYKSPTKDNPL